MSVAMDFISHVGSGRLHTVYNALRRHQSPDVNYVGETPLSMAVENGDVDMLVRRETPLRRAPHRAPSKLPGVGPYCNLNSFPCVWQALLLLFKADPAPEKRGHKAVLPLAQAYAKNPKHKHHAVAGEMIKLLSDIKYVETKKPALEEKVKKMMEEEYIRIKRNTKIVSALLLGTAVYFYFFHSLGADQEL